MTNEAALALCGLAAVGATVFFAVWITLEVRGRSARWEAEDAAAREDKAREERLNTYCAKLAEQYDASLSEIGRDEHGDFHAIHHHNHASAFTESPIDYAAWARELRRRRACIQFNRPRCVADIVPTR